MLDFRAAVSFSLLLLVPVTAQAVQVVSAPTLTMNPNGRTPLAGVVEFVTDVPVRAVLKISDGTGSRRLSFGDSARTHSLPVLGLKPGTTYTIDVAVVPGGPIGTVFATTGPLPADFPARVVHISTPKKMEPGYILLDCFNRAPGSGSPYGMILDNAGDVVWYTTECGRGVLQQPNGELMWRTNELLYRMDMLGNLRSLQLQDPGQGLHHELLPTPHGTYLSLTTRSVDVPAFPTSETDPDAPFAPATLRDEGVVEFLPDGTLRREWPLLDLTDPFRIGYDSLFSTADGLDYAHTNAVAYDATDDSIVVSARHQDAVYKFSRQTGQLIWILGNHANWSPALQPYLLHPVGTPFRWQYHQHAPTWTGAHGLLLFDNGNRRASPFDGTVPVPNEQNFSRAVEYAIDPELMQVRQVWQYGENAPERVYSFYISDANWEPLTNNRLIVFGGVSHVDGMTSASLGLGQSHTRVVEATSDTESGKVFDMTLYDPSGGQINTYRGARIPSLYPPQDVRRPGSVGNTVRLGKRNSRPLLSWEASPTAASQGGVYYIGLVSSSIQDGFTMFDSTANTHLDTPDRSEPLLYYKVVAANSAGTSEDNLEP